MNGKVATSLTESKAYHRAIIDAEAPGDRANFAGGWWRGALLFRYESLSRTKGKRAPWDDVGYRV